MKKEKDHKKMKNVLFIGMTDYDLSKENPTLKKKFEGLSRGFNAHVLSRGKGWKVEKYNTHFYLTPKFFGKAGMPFWLVIAFFRGLAIIFTKKIDTIVVQSPAFEGSVGAMLKILTGRELIVEAHGDWINSYFHYFSIPFEKQIKVILTALGKFSLRRANKIRTISVYTRSLVNRFVGDTPKYHFSTFTDIDIFKTETNVSWEKTIVYVGVLYRLKGVQFLIEAFNNLRKDFPGYKIIVVGDGPYREDLEKFMGAGEDSQIEFVGRKELSEVKDIMRSCTVFVLPSLSEGLGRVLIEAAMLSKPLVGSRVDGIPDLVHEGENGYLFEPGNVKELEEKLRKILGDPEKAKEMGVAGRKYMLDNFSTEGYIESYIKMIND
ncbi:MAG: glycosyltransferase family 4 protein [Candidatus Pacebacteria bacterium]|nr:glycosyltransferase family 4 protein [Candidatus Paceibacterota bacterium]